MAQEKAQPKGATEQPAHGGGHFPPFESHTFASQVLWLAIVFAALYWVMARFALPRIGAILEARRERIAGDLAAAQRLKDQSDAAIAAYEKALADARARAQALANETREKQAAAAEARRKALEAELNAKIAEAEKAIAATRSAAMANVHGIAAEAAAAIVERLTGLAPASQEVATAVGDALKR
jgi:F-type H+-transporting ATPase subunit b